MKPVQNQQYTFYMSLTSQSNPKIHQNNPTLTAGDVKVATDDDVPANINTLPLVDADFQDRIKVTLSESEMDGEEVTIIFSDAAGDEWCDVTVSIQTILFDPDKLGTVSAVNDVSATTASFDTDLIEATDDHYKDSTLVFLEGVLAGQNRPVSAYNGTYKIITVNPVFTDVPADNDRFIILGRSTA